MSLTKEQEALLHSLYFKDKVIFGVGRDRLFKYLQDNYGLSGITRRQVAKWLKDNEINQLFRKREPVKDLQRTIVSAPRKLIEIDLIDMSSKASGQFKWILNGIDVFSKKAYSVPLTDKSEETVLEGIKTMVEQMKTPPKAIRSDNGSEFTNEGFVNYAERKGITLINGKPRTPQSQSNVERFNGVLKRLIEMYRVQFNNPEWIRYLGKLIETYNNTWQKTIDSTPNKIDEGDEPSEEVKKRIEDAVVPKNDKEIQQKFEPGDKVRILLEKENQTGVGGKSFRNWSDEIYTVAKVFVPRADSVYTYSYQIKDPEGDLVLEKFYQSQLQMATVVNNKIKEPKKYKVSSIVKAVIMGDGEPGFEVKWVGYRKKSDNTEEPRETLIQDVPKMVKEFEEKNNVVWKDDGTVSQKEKAKKSSKKSTAPESASAPPPTTAQPNVRRSGRIAGNNK